MFVAFVVLSCAVTYTSAAQFLQLSDFHFDKDYSAQFGNIAEKCHQKSGLSRSKLGQFGDYACDSPKSLIRRALAAAKEVIPNPDFVFWTGDNVPHIDDYNETYVEQVLQILSSMVYTAYPNVSVLPLFGNHDYAPSNAFPDHNCTLYNTIYKMWKRWIGSANMDTFLKGGYYKYAAPNNVTILALNTNLYYKFNRAIPSFTNPSDPADQFKFMSDTLETAQRQHQTVHVIAHIAPGVFERTPNFTWMLPQYNQRFIDITVRYADTIKWMIFGHHHTDTFHIVKNPRTGNAVQVYLMAPAVTPWFSSLEGAGANNPAFRVFDYDVRTQELLDAKTYYVDLNLLNKNASTKWQLEYSMSQTYGISAITPRTMNDVLNKIKTDDSMMMKYIEYNSVRWNYSMPIGKFRAAQLCALEYPDFAGYNSCMSYWSTVSSTGPVSTTTLSEAETHPTASSGTTQSDSQTTTDQTPHPTVTSRTTQSSGTTQSDSQTTTDQTPHPTVTSRTTQSSGTTQSDSQTTTDQMPASTTNLQNPTTSGTSRNDSFHAISLLLGFFLLRMCC